MNNTIKLLLFTILLCSAPAAQTMGSVRTFGARAFKAASATAAKFKVNAQAFKTHKQPFAKPCTFKNGGKQGGYKKYAHTAALMPMIKVGALYGAYDRVKEWLGYGSSSFVVTARTCTVENLQKHPEHIKDFIDFALQNMANDKKYVSVVLHIVKSKPELMNLFAEQALNLFEEVSASYQIKRKNSVNISGTERFLETISKQRNLSAVLMASCCTPQHIERLARTSLFLDESISISTETPFLKGLMSLIDTNSKNLDSALRPKGSSLLDYAYKHADESTKKVLEEKMQRLIAKKYENFVFLPEGAKLNEKILQFIKHAKYPLWAYGLERRLNRDITQTEAHLKANNFVQDKLETLSPDLKQFVIKVNKKEQEERDKGNYVFYHAQAWKLHYYADIYKQLWNIAKNDSVQDDFTFTRFNQEKKFNCLRKDSLFLNHALFGNNAKPGSCTYDYFVSNQSVHQPEFSPYQFCKNLGMKNHCAKYAKEFEQLEDLHSSLSSKGNLLMVSIPKRRIHHVLPYERTIFGFDSLSHIIRKVKVGNEWTSDAKKIIDTMKQNPGALETTDTIEYILPLTTHYALDPKNGPRIYSFNAADKEKLKKYTEARDTLFAKIKQDFEQDQAAGKA